MATRNSIKKIDAEKMAQGIYQATFSDGVVISFNIQSHLEKAGVAFTDLPPMVQRFLAYGVKQKLDDSMADVDGDVALAQQELTSTIECIDKEQWTTRVAGEGETGGLFARAFAAVKGISLSESKAFISALVEKNKKIPANADVSERAIMNAIRNQALAATPALKAKYDELRAARETKVSSKITVDLSMD